MFGLDDPAASVSLLYFIRYWSRWPVFMGGNKMITGQLISVAGY